MCSSIVLIAKSRDHLAVCSSRNLCSMSTLKVPDHQVAGHKAINGKLGPVIDESGRFYKPLQRDERGSKEVAFYEKFSSDTRVPDHVRKFFPKFYGTELLEASDGSGKHPHLVLEDLISNHTNPSIMDVKIGSRTWYPQASDEHFQKCFKKDRETSTLPLGFRISGLQIYEGEKSGYWRPKMQVTQRYTAEEVRLVLRKFVSSNTESPELNEDSDCAFASNVYGGSSGILAQLIELKSWFEDQTIYHFYSCSVLIVHDKEYGRPAIKLIDFAHVLDGNGIIDHNFLGGLCSFIKFISEILPTTTNGCTAEPHLEN